MTSRNGEFEMRELGSQRTNLYGSMAPPNDYTLPPPDEDSIQSLMVNSKCAIIQWFSLF